MGDEKLFETNILAHDTRPRDPTEFKTSPNHFYEPSTGQPTRNFRRVNHFVGNDFDGAISLDEPVRVSMAKQEPPPRHRPRRRITQPEVKQNHEFLSAKPQAKKGQGVKTLHSNPDVIKKEQEARQLRSQVKTDLLQQMNQEKQRQMEIRQQEEALIKSHLNHDPWTKPDQVIPKAVLQGKRAGKKSVLEKGDHFQTDSNCSSYASQMFGKQGSGAPRIDDKGQIIAKRPIIVAKQKHHQDSTSSGYMSQNFGKSAVPKDDKGNVNARRIAQVSNMKVHQASNEAGSYFAKHFGNRNMPTDARRTKEKVVPAEPIKPRPIVSFEKQLQRENAVN